MTSLPSQVNLRLAAEITAVEAHREIFAAHAAIPLCPLGRVIRKLQLTAIWTPKTLTLSCVNKSGTAHGLTQRPIKGDTPYFTAVPELQHLHPIMMYDTLTPKCGVNSCGPRWIFVGASESGISPLSSWKTNHMGSADSHIKL